MIRDAEYFSKLFAATWGRNITVAAIVLDAIGIAWVMRILKTSKQT
jgi:Flp pilus assembly protein TadB